MRLGHFGDIHEEVQRLTAVVRALKAERVEAFVMLGDVVEAGECVDETVAILSKLPGVGVWGNHDYGLCRDIDAPLPIALSAATREYFAGLRAFVELEGCRFQHIDPHLDPESMQDLWSFSLPADRIAGLMRSTHRRAFVGHLHEWDLCTTGRPIPWDGERDVRYEPHERYLTVINSVTNGCCAILDTERDELRPIRVL